MPVKRRPPQPAPVTEPPPSDRTPPSGTIEKARAVVADADVGFAVLEPARELAFGQSAMSGTRKRTRRMASAAPTKPPAFSLADIPEVKIPLDELTTRAI